MRKIVLTFGLISGVLISAMMAATIPFQHQIGSDKAMFVGYTTMVLSFLLVFFGERSYRETVGGGLITFSKGFAVGISITMITCICYVLTWEIIYHFFMPDFMDQYSAHMVEKAKASGMSQAALQQQLEQIQKMKALYANPLINAAMTLIEPFPVGLAITLLSAAVLRRSRKATARHATTPVAS